MFEKGEYVVYGSKGVCRIQEISHVDIPGVDQKRLYYIMHPVQNSGQTLYLPTDSTKAVIRRVMTKEEANRLIHDIPSIKKLEVPNEKQREASYKQALQGMQRTGLDQHFEDIEPEKRRTAGGRQENNRTG